MFEEEITQLYKKINEYKQTYEKAKTKRLQLVSEIELLDNEILKYKNYEAEMMEQNNSPIIIKDELKKRMRYTFNLTTLSFIILVIINTIIGNFSTFISQILITLTINTVGNIILPLVLITIKNYSSAKKEEQLKIQYKKLIEQRLIIGQKYKKTWEEEVLFGKIYKAIESIVLEQINENKRVHSVINEVNIQDIYRSIVLYPSFFEEKTEDQITIIDEELRRYLAKKISECYHNKIETDYLLTYSAPELLKILIREISENEHNEKLRHIIHATLGFYGNVQKYSIIWFEEKDTKLIDDPELVFDENGKLIELKTHTSTDYKMLFTKLYNSFINSSRQSKSKSRIKE